MKIFSNRNSNYLNKSKYGESIFNKGKYNENSQKKINYIKRISIKSKYVEINYEENKNIIKNSIIE